MRSIFLSIIGAFAFLAGYSETIISGTADEAYVGKKIFLFQEADAFSERMILLDSVTVAQDGSFELKGEVKRTSLLVINSFYINFPLFASPGKNYKVSLRDVNDRQFRALGSKTTIYPAFFDLPETDINARISDFNIRFDILMDSLLENPFSPQYYQTLNNFLETETQKAKLTRDSFFADYVHYAVASQLLNSRYSQKKFFENYLQDQRYSIYNPMFAQVFKTFFTDLVESIDRYSKTKTLQQQMKSNSPDVATYYKDLSQLDFLKNEELKAIGACWAIAEVFGDKNFNKKSMLTLLNGMAIKMPVAYKELAKNYVYELGRFEKGASIENTHYYTDKGAKVILKDLISKPTVLVYWAGWSNYARNEISLLQSLGKKWGSSIQLVLVSVDGASGNMANNNIGVECNWLDVGENQYALFQHRVVSIPKFTLLDANGNILKEWLPSPSEGLAEAVDKLLKL